MGEGIWAAVAGALVVVGAVVWLVVRGRGELGSPAQRATYQALHTASQAAPALRGGLSREGATRAVGALQRLVGGGVILADQLDILAVSDVDPEHRSLLEEPLMASVRAGRPVPLGPRQLACGDSMCPLQGGVAVPLWVDGEVVGAMGVVATSRTGALTQLASEVGRFVSTQLELAELARARSRADQAELRFLRAQIAPHFVYNALTAIEAFIRTDPTRARELLIEFADFTRYTFRRDHQFVTLAEELRLLDTYLDLERARFGDRLSISVRVAPAVLSVELPALVVQPLVENAVRHGIEGHSRSACVSVVVTDEGNEACIRIDDDGAGADPVRLVHVLSGSDGSDAVGLRNVDERLRAVFGEDFGLRIRTSAGAGTTVTLRIPKRRPASARSA